MKGINIKKKIQKILIRIKRELAKETRQTHFMFKVYGRHLQGRSSKNELKAANRQFAQVLKSMGLGILVVLPFAPVTLPFVVKIGKYFGIDILPDYFKDEEEK